MKCVQADDDTYRYYIYPGIKPTDDVEASSLNDYNGIIYADGKDLVFEYIIKSYVNQMAPAMTFIVLSDELPVNRFIIRVRKDSAYWADGYVNMYVQDYDMMECLMPILEILDDND
jgi:hypothetical protein